MKTLLKRNNQAFFIGLLILINAFSCHFGNNPSLTSRGKISEELVNKLEKYPMLQEKLQQWNNGELEDIDEIIALEDDVSSSMLGLAIVYSESARFKRGDSYSPLQEIIIALLQNGASTAATIKWKEDPEDIAQPILVYVFQDTNYLSDEVLRTSIEKSSLKVIEEQQWNSGSVSLLGYLVKSYKQEFIPDLLKKGARVDHTILLDACQEKYMEVAILQALITHVDNETINEPIKDQEGNTLLHWAIKNSKTLAFWLLELHKQKLINIEDSLLLKNNNEETAQALIKADDGLKLLYQAESLSQFVDQQSMAWLQCLQEEITEEEAKENHKHLLECLRNSRTTQQLNGKITLNIDEETIGFNALELAIYLLCKADENSSELHVHLWGNIISQLINNGAILIDFPYLSLAASTLTDSLLEALMQSGAANTIDLNKEEYDSCPLEIVTNIFDNYKIEDKNSMMNLLSDKGLNINNTHPKTKNTLLHWASEKGKKDLISWLLDLHEDPTVKIDLTGSLTKTNTAGKTPLEIADKSSGFYERLKKLTEDAE